MRPVAPAPREADLGAATGRIRIGVSSCLLGESVRYDGQHKRDRLLTEVLSAHFDFVPVCPEIEVGMGVPREPIALRAGPGRGAVVRLVGVQSGTDHTHAMRAYAARRIAELAALDLAGYVFKAGSPSCGARGVPVWRGGRASRTGVGMFARALREALPQLPVVEEGGLADPRRRQRFLERVRAYVRARVLAAAGGGRIDYSSIEAPYRETCMEIDQLRTFLAVLEHGTFSRAGEALRIGQSTVSFHIKALETAVGSRVLDRGGGQVGATAAGEELRKYAMRILSLHDEALGRLRAAEKGDAGQVVVAASTIPAEYLLPPVLGALFAAHPGVSVRVDVSDSRRALAALVDHACDLALVGQEPRERRVVASAFAEDEVVLVGAPALVPAGKTTVHELAGVRFVVREEGSGTRGAVATILAQAAPSRAAVVQVGSSEAARRCALQGVGLAFISRRAVAEDLESGRLRVAKVEGTPVRRRFWVARLRTTTPSGAVRALREALVRHYR